MEIRVVFTSCKDFKVPDAPVAASVFYSFDSSLDGWSSNGTSGESLSINTNTTYVEAGTGSAKCICSLGALPAKIAILYQYFPGYVNLTSRTVTIWVYVPVDLAAMNPGFYLDLWYRRDSQPGWEWKPGYTLNTAGWVKETYTFPPYSTDSSYNTYDFHDVSAMYFAVENNMASPADWNGTIYFDELSW